MRPSTIMDWRTVVSGGNEEIAMTVGVADDCEVGTVAAPAFKAGRINKRKLLTA
jgi:hypothetical protein